MPLPKKLRTSEPEKENNGVPNKNNCMAVDNQKPAAAKTLVKKSKAKNTVTVAPAPPAAVMPSHPDDKINVDDMIVNDLRKELRKRQLSTSGRKADLQARLREHLAEEKQKREAEWASKHPVVEEEDDEVEVIEVTTTQIKQVKISNKKSVEEMDVVMEDANEAVEDGSMRSVSDEAELLVVKKGDKAAKDPPDVESEPVVSAKSLSDTSMKKEQQAAPKSALKPSKYTSSSVNKSTPEVFSENVSSVHKQLLPTKVSDSSTDTTDVAASVTNKGTKLQSSVQKNKISSTLAHTTTTPSFKTKVGGVSGSAKLLEKKKAHTAASEARKQRLAEMRQKVRLCYKIGRPCFFRVYH